LAEKKICGSTVPSAAVGKAFADGFYVFADGFGHSATDLFPVVHLLGMRVNYLLFQLFNLNKALSVAG
jgi:hypothetical protein